LSALIAACERDGREIGTAAAERGDLAASLMPWKPAHDDHVAGLQIFSSAPR